METMRSHVRSHLLHIQTITDQGLRIQYTIIYLGINDQLLVETPVIDVEASITNTRGEIARTYYRNSHSQHPGF